jgi:hypothetical protein
LEVEQVTSDLCRVQRLVLTGQCQLGRRGHLLVGKHPLVRGLREVVTLGHLRALAVFLDQFLRGCEEVGLQPQQRVDLVEHGELAGVSQRW